MTSDTYRAWRWIGDIDQIGYRLVHKSTNGGTGTIGRLLSSGLLPNEVRNISPVESG
jgi:hypothetical protein